MQLRSPIQFKSDTTVNGFEDQRATIIFGSILPAHYSHWLVAGVILRYVQFTFIMWENSSAVLIIKSKLYVLWPIFCIHTLDGFDCVYLSEFLHDSSIYDYT